MSYQYFTEQEIAGEEWRDIPGITGYQASSLGRIKGKRSEILSPDKIKGDYLRVAVYTPFRKRFLVSHLVLIAFNGPRPGGLVACHRDGKTKNNRPENLRWDTNKANHADKKDHGTYPDGENNNRAKLTNADAVEIRRLYSEKGLLQRELAIIFGVSRPSIGHVLNRTTFYNV